VCEYSLANDNIDFSEGIMSTFNFVKMTVDINNGISNTLGFIGGVIGACSGGAIGFIITSPLAASGALLVSAGFLGAGIFGGAFMGSALIWATGSALGYVISHFFS
jgi:hypothetical protein